jgi:2-keto-4-pentenoate hydratase/2-oxohepta-3-ene-1,7-dioic acid hydratase in catechol pathway
MRLATIVEGDRTVVGHVRGDRYLPIPSDERASGSTTALARGVSAALERARAFVSVGPESEWRPLEGVSFGPAVRDPGAIYTIAANYRSPWDTDERPDRPRVLAKLPSSVTGHGATVRWDRSVTANVDAECELGVVIGSPALDVSAREAMGHVFGYTIVNDLNSVDPWLDGDQWLLGKSMPGFCPLGPWIVTADELDPTDVRLGSTINGTAIQDGRTSQMRFSIAEVISYISLHVELRPGDVIATGTPPRLEGPYAADRHLERGDVVSCWIEGIGELTTTIG